jgi:hypothetical protein
MKKVFNLEIMPAEKSCEQWCPQCPLSSKHKPIQATSIDDKVQKTFSLLEHKLYTEQRLYDLHFASRMDLFPNIKHPQLVRMARFESNKSISLPGMQQAYADDIQRTIDLAKIDPQHVCFSFVPKSPVLTQEEIDIVRKVMYDIGKWFLIYGKKKKLSCTIRSNFLTEQKLQNLLETLRDTDKTNLDTILSNLFSNQRKSPWLFSVSEKIDNPYGAWYFSKFKKQVDSDQLEVSNRAIAHKKISPALQTALDEKHKSYPYMADPLVDQSFYWSIWNDILISPEGVMIDHTSLTINNPLFWVHHEDFENILRSAKNKSLRKICLDILEQNTKIYIFLKMQNISWLNKQEYMDIFADARMKFKKEL